MSEEFRRKLHGCAVLPIVTIRDAEHAAALAEALKAGGIGSIEITLRTPQSLEAIRRIAGEVEGIEVGAGTLRTGRQIEEALSAGARFLVSPGLSPELTRAAASSPVPFLPGVSTASEAMAAAEAGFQLLKFFPAESIGGAAALAALAGPLPDIAFCPTGGIGAERAADYLKLPNVVCVGGSWVAPPDAMEAGDWERVTALARMARALRPA